MSAAARAPRQWVGSADIGRVPMTISIVFRALVLAVLWALATLGAMLAQAGAEDDSVAQSRARFALEVDRRLEVPADDQRQYIGLLDATLARAGLSDLRSQAVLLVDRSVNVQAAFLIVRTGEGGWTWLGASPVSTGRVGSFDHFETPLGVFAHSLENPDFRAEGTFNRNRIRGYGLRGMRVYDFGWTQALRGWGDGGQSTMRLQMHATDPDTLEPRLGRAESKGCIRIPATLNVFLDRYGLLDADYEQAVAAGRSLWVLRPDRQPVPWAGRYLVIVDSLAAERPAWAPLPGAQSAVPGVKPPVPGAEPAVPGAKPPVPSAPASPVGVSSPGAAAC